MTTITMIKASEIQSRIDAIDTRIADFSEIEGQKALAALSGDQSAADELARNKAEGLRLAEERGLLVKAKIAAEQQEEDVRAAEEEKRRLTHVNAARDAAKKILPHAARIDALRAEFVAVTEELSRLEKVVKTERHKAGIPDTGRTYTTNLAAIAVNQFARLNGPAFQRVVLMFDLMAAAFADLLSDEIGEV